MNWERDTIHGLTLENREVVIHCADVESITVYLTTGNDILCGAQVNVEYKPGRSPRDPWPRRLLALPGKIRDRYTPFAREVERGQYLPPGYGLAWHRLDRRTIIAYPMPLNVAARIIYKVWAWCLWPFHEATWLERMIAASRVPDSPEVKAYWRESDGRKLKDDLRDLVAIHIDTPIGTDFAAVAPSVADYAGTIQAQPLEVTAALRAGEMSVPKGASVSSAVYDHAARESVYPSGLRLCDYDAAFVVTPYIAYLQGVLRSPKPKAPTEPTGSRKHPASPQEADDWDRFDREMESWCRSWSAWAARIAQADKELAAISDGRFTIEAGALRFDEKPTLRS